MHCAIDLAHERALASFVARASDEACARDQCRGVSRPNGGLGRVDPVVQCVPSVAEVRQDRAFGLHQEAFAAAEVALHELAIDLLDDGVEAEILGVELARDRQVHARVAHAAGRDSSAPEALVRDRFPQLRWIRRVVLQIELLEPQEVPIFEAVEVELEAALEGAARRPVRAVAFEANTDLFDLVPRDDDAARDRILEAIPLRQAHASRAFRVESLPLGGVDGQVDAPESVDAEEVCLRRRRCLLAECRRGERARGGDPNCGQVSHV